ncbi:MAG: uroporphyrinogen decarboxylase family protein [Kiritimatiellales bacterium]
MCPDASGMQRWHVYVSVQLRFPCSKHYKEHGGFFSFLHKYPNLCHQHNIFYVQHSCDVIRSIIPYFIECGVDVLDPIQKVTNMEPEGLKRDFGDKLCFHGGIDTQKLLPHGTPEEVRAEAEHFIEVLNRNGGYILGPSQNFEGDVPVENILALYAARGL